ncbi:glycosyltransferase family 2 protein [Halalkalibacter krulwichiae]|uniref:glycosyltransferase family 2 protein n=1 Tax=Halalkalibacter krulwichiae TaxID=199441 RepID=UPI00082623EC|nr:glycosyltransferase family 2 protein [Halalkalibacter krulwichiae]
MIPPLVTVFIPLYNCEKYIKDALNSIVNQSYSNLDILIVDDGSTDNSLEIVKSFDDPRIRIVENPENKGIPYTRNKGLKNAKGKYMAIMDADDIATFDRIEKQVRYMEENLNIDAIGTYFKLFGQKLKRTVKPALCSPEEIKVCLLFSNPIGNPTSFIRLDTLNKYNIKYNLDYFVAQDYDFWAQLSKVGNLAILPEVLLNYRTGHSNITKTSIQTKAVKRKKVINSIHQDLLNYYGFELTKDEIQIYYDFYNDAPQNGMSGITILDLSNLLEKMIKQNNEKKIFEETLFLKVLFNTTFSMGILNNPFITLENKIELYNRLTYMCKAPRKSKEKFYFMLKHLYRLFR